MKIKIYISFALCIVLLVCNFTAYAEGYVQFTESPLDRYNVYVSGVTENFDENITVLIKNDNKIGYINQFQTKSDGSYMIKFPYSGNIEKATFMLRDSENSKDITDTISHITAQSNMLAVDIDIKNYDDNKPYIEPGDILKINSKIKNKYLDNTVFNVILAAFNVDGSLISSKIQKFDSGYELSSEISETVTDFDIPEETEFVKAFVWSVSDLTPFGRPSKILSKPVTVHLLGDSLCCDYTNIENDYYPQTGWGQLIGEYFVNGVVIDNQAKAGWSTKAFLLANSQTTSYDPDKLNNPENSLWQRILPTINEGDFVIVSFAINDAMQTAVDFYYEDSNGDYVLNSDGKTYTKVDSGKGQYSFYTWKSDVNEYKQNLQKFIDDIHAKKATPILYSSTGICSDSMYTRTQDYTDAMKEIANQNNVCYLDGYYTYKNYISENGGYDAVANINHFTKENLLKFKEQGMKLGTVWSTRKTAGDTTHYNLDGAKYVTQMIVDLIIKSDSSLKQYIN